MNATGKLFYKYKLEHVIFWIITVVFFIYSRIDLIDRAGWPQFLLEIFVRNALLILICYANILWLIPRFFQTKRYTAFIGFVFLLLIFYACSKSLHDEYLNEYLIKGVKKSFLQNVYYNFSIALFYVCITMGLELSKEWFIQRDYLQKIKIEHLNSEINYLKAQINPHFLFNSLNTLYVQIDQKNVEAKTTLEKISEMLRYQLYDCNNDTISMEKELEYIGNYIDIQKLRRENNCEISYCYDASVKTSRVAPLLLIPFVENAFKHLSNFNDRANIVRVDVKEENGNMICTVYNTSNNSINKNNDGIGLKNVKRRLELLYPDKHQLEIDQRDHSFEVKLSITLS
jgi:two-component system LytT family sensor kinase